MPFRGLTMDEAMSSRSPTFADLGVQHLTFNTGSTIKGTVPKTTGATPWYRSPLMLVGLGVAAFLFGPKLLKALKRGGKGGRRGARPFARA
jgi:hypothetical protein